MLRSTQSRAVICSRMITTHDSHNRQPLPTTLIVKAGSAVMRAVSIKEGLPPQHRSGSRSLQPVDDDSIHRTAKGVSVSTVTIRKITTSLTWEDILKRKPSTLGRANRLRELLLVSASGLLLGLVSPAEARVTKI